MTTNVHCGVDPTENIQSMGENKGNIKFGV